jgi:hypothetical protein
LRPIDIDRNEILVRLSNTKVRKIPTEKLRNQIENMIQIAVENIEEDGAYKIFDRSELLDRPYFEEAEKIALGICTIGATLPDLTDKYLKDGQLSDGVILDAIGSVVVDQIADLLNKEINDVAHEMGLVPSMRYSPGYCDMGVEDQDIIFDRIDNIGVTLLPSKMMQPIKSIRFVVNLGERFINRCKTCERENCQHRR